MHRKKKLDAFKIYFLCIQVFAGFSPPPTHLSLNQNHSIFTIKIIDYLNKQLLIVPLKTLGILLKCYQLSLFPTFSGHYDIEYIFYSSTSS